MRIALIIEYFPPFATGGSEWSTFYLGKDLAKIHGNEVFVFTPDYGDKSYEKIEGFKVIRFPFYKKFKKNSSLPSSFFYVNPLWNIWVGFWILLLSVRYKIDVLHINGKYSLIPARLANILLRKKILVTIRDYQVICNYGFCLFNKDRACSLTEYFTKDFIFYIKHYTDKSIISVLINFLFAVFGRITTKLLKTSCRKIKVVALSKRQAKILKANGIRDVDVIYNSISFENKAKPLKKEKAVLFVGRLTLGKGILLLIVLLDEFFRLFPNYKFEFVGEGPLHANLKKLEPRFPNLKLYAQTNHKQVQELISRAQVTVIPSIWPEPFGRVALESIINFTPAVVTNRGGLPEIVKDGEWGFVVEPNSGELLEGVKKSIKNNKELIDNISKSYLSIKEKFGENIAVDYMRKYRKL